MNIMRLYQSFRLCLIPSAKKRAEYLRKHHIFASMGVGCSIMKRKIPLYPNLIKIGNNVQIASNVSFLTHDITHTMLNKLPAAVRGEAPFCETIGCIEIGDNVFIGSQTRILPNRKIGSNVIIGTGSTITHDIPDNSIVAGSPARIIGDFASYLEKRKAEERYPREYRAVKQEIPPEFAKNLWERFDREKTVNKIGMEEAET